MCNPNWNCLGVPSAYVPDWKVDRNGVRLDPGATPPTTFGARSPLAPGRRDAPGKFPAGNAFQKLKRLKTLALGSMVTRSRNFMGQDTLKSIDLSQGIPTACGATDAIVGITQPRAAISPGVITGEPEISPEQKKGLLGAVFPARHWPAGVSVPAKVWL